jgi:hypothetical protein
LHARAERVRRAGGKFISVIERIEIIIRKRLAAGNAADFAFRQGVYADVTRAWRDHARAGGMPEADIDAVLADIEDAVARIEIEHQLSIPLPEHDSWPADEAPAAAPDPAVRAAAEQKAASRASDLRRRISILAGAATVAAIAIFGVFAFLGRDAAPAGPLETYAAQVAAGREVLWIWGRGAEPALRSPPHVSIGRSGPASQRILQIQVNSAEIRNERIPQLAMTVDKAYGARVRDAAFQVIVIARQAQKNPSKVLKAAFQDEKEALRWQEFALSSNYQAFAFEVENGHNLATSDNSRIVLNGDGKREDSGIDILAVGIGVTPIAAAAPQQPASN